MTEIKLEMMIWGNSQSSIQKYQEIFGNLNLDEELFGYPITLTTNVRVEEKNHAKESGLKKGSYKYYIISFVDTIATDVDVENNSIYYYNGPRTTKEKTIDTKEYQKYFKYDTLDDDFLEQLKAICNKIVICTIISYPEIKIAPAYFRFYLNSMEFNDHSFITSFIQDDFAKVYSKIITSEVSIQQTWDWLRGLDKGNNSICIQKIIKTISYILNREFHEILLYSVMSLESLYLADDQRGISTSLQKRIPLIVKNATQDKIKAIYNQRSSFAHGSAEFGNLILIQDIIDNEKEFEDNATYAFAILIETLRVLIINNASKIVFHESITTSFE